MYRIAVFWSRCVENRTELVAEDAHQVDLEAAEVALDGVPEFVPRELACLAEYEQAILSRYHASEAAS
jgi:hypothetical protein